MAKDKTTEQGTESEEIKAQLELYQLIFDTIPSGAMVTDPQGKVLQLNQPYARFLGTEVATSIGRHCTEVVENTRMHIVGSTGVAEINQIQNIRGQNIVVHRIPVRKDGRVVAVFGLVMFQDISEVAKLAKKLHLLESRVKNYEHQLRNLRSTRFTLESIVGSSRIIAGLREEALMAATNISPVLITGESGTGKELFAQAIHHAGPRRSQAFIQINCAAIPKDLLESELFGYERGAFTGAQTSGKPGKFELADHGTIFLDEIGDLPLEMQPKLLRVLEEKCFERVGGNSLLRSDFRLIAATNQDLEEMIAKGLFRQDLYYRLNVISLHIPPLRERREDIAILVRHLLAQAAGRNGSGPIGISDEAMAALAGHPWRGNVREMANVLERALLSMRDDEIQLGDLPLMTRQTSQGARSVDCSPIRAVQANAEREAILSALRQSGNNKSKAAALLGIHRTLLYKKMKKYGLPLAGVTQL